MVGPLFTDRLSRTDVSVRVDGRSPNRSEAHSVRSASTVARSSMMLLRVQRPATCRWNRQCQDVGRRCRVRSGVGAVGGNVCNELRSRPGGRTLLSNARGQVNQHGRVRRYIPPGRLYRLNGAGGSWPPRVLTVIDVFAFALVCLSVFCVDIVYFL